MAEFLAGYLHCSCHAVVIDAASSKFIMSSSSIIIVYCCQACASLKSFKHLIFKYGLTKNLIFEVAIEDDTVLAMRLRGLGRKSLQSFKVQGGLFEAPAWL